VDVKTSIVHAVRTLQRAPWYAATALGTITLTIALGSTVFAVVDGVLFKPLPYPDAHRLFSLMGSSGKPGEGTASLSARDVEYLAAADPRIRVIATGGGTSFTHPSRPDVTIWAASVDPAFFDVIGQYPLVGGFTAEHFQPALPGAPQPAIVSYTFWQQWLGGDTRAVGRTLEMLTARLLVVGVLPRDFLYPAGHARITPAVLVPQVLTNQERGDRWNRRFTGIVRLQDGITKAEAAAKLDAAMAAQVHQYATREGTSIPGPYARVVWRSLDAEFGSRERPLFRPAFAGAVLLIVLGAINVSGLFVARIRDRARELSVRVALGARRRDVAGLLLGESLLVAIAGGALGALLASPLLEAALALLPDSLLLLKEPRVDWRVAVFAAAAAVGPVLLFSSIPVLSAIGVSNAERLSAAAASTPRVRTWGRSSLLAAETAIGLTLVLSGSLLLASFVVLRSQDSGFDADSLAVVQLRTTRTVTPPERDAIEQRAIARMRTVPGVSGVATASTPVLERMFGGSDFEIPPGGRRHFANDVRISSGFFEVTGLTLLDGRLPTPEETETSRPIAVVGALTAEAYWPGARAVGQVLESRAGSATVIGVVEDARFGSQDDDRMGEIYLPGTGRRYVYFLKTAGDPDDVARDVALALRSDVPEVLVRRAESLDAALSRSVRPHRFRMALFALAGGAALLLVAVGVAGLVATSVARRVREIGIRTALGARRRQLVSMIVLEHLRPSIAGVLAGALASWWASTLLGAFLYGIDAHEPLVWTAAIATLVGVSAIAAWLPARRASAVDPIVVLRVE
jgi:predicted permease